MAKQPIVYPVPVRAKPIGYPRVGTHQQSDWQSANAIDIPADPGTPVFAAESGKIVSLDVHPDHVVTTATGKRLAGTGVGLTGGQNRYFYAHLKDIQVQVGQKVVAGQVIGYTGVLNHVHFAVEKGNPEIALNDAVTPQGAPDPTQPTTGATGGSTPTGASATPPVINDQVGPQGVALVQPFMAENYNSAAPRPQQTTWQLIASLPGGASLESQRLASLSSLPDGTSP